jgi:hypothetical protein
MGGEKTDFLDESAHNHAYDTFAAVRGLLTMAAVAIPVWASIFCWLFR